MDVHISIENFIAYEPNEEVGFDDDAEIKQELDMNITEDDDKDLDLKDQELLVSVVVVLLNQFCHNDNHSNNRKNTRIPWISFRLMMNLM